MIHVAILKPGYIQAILAGTKTIESRLTKTAQPPYGKVVTGERLYLKASGGPSTRNTAKRSAAMRRTGGPSATAGTSR